MNDRITGWIIAASVGFGLCLILHLQEADSYKVKLSAAGLEIEAKQRSIEGLASVVQRLNRPERANH